MLYEDEDLLVVRKPAGLVCHPTKGDAWSSLVSRVRHYLGVESEPQMVHRLDRETSGVMVFGKNAEASLTLRELWRQGFVTKQYCALVRGRPKSAAGVIRAPIGRDERSVVAIKDCVCAGGAPAWTAYRVDRTWLWEGHTYSQVQLWLGTGRKHQIRIHLEWCGCPIVGDKLYGGDERLYLAFVERRLSGDDRRRLILPYQALHASHLWFPWRGRELEFTASPEDWFLGFAEAEGSGRIPKNDSWGCDHL